MRIDYAGLTFNDGVPDANGAYWYITGMDGWGGPGMRQTLGNPTGQDGAVVVESLLDSRFISLRGVCKTPSEAAFWTSYNNLIALTNNINSARELVVYETVPKMVMCYRAEAPILDFVGVGSFVFEIGLTCPDPLKYELAEQSTVIAAGGQASIVNGGSYYSAPRIVAGGVVRVQHNESGGILSTGEATVPGGTVFDHRTKTVKHGNANLYGQLAPNSLWWNLYPGPNVVKNLGGSSVQVFYRNASL